MIALFPLRDRLWIKPVAQGYVFGRSLRSLYCCSNGVRCRGAAMKYLSHGLRHRCAESGLELIYRNKIITGVDRFLMFLIAASGSKGFSG